jgi:hypothetical protein
MMAWLICIRISPSTWRHIGFVSESSIYLFFIVVHTNIWLLKMPDVPEHFDWVVHGHEEVVDLIWSLDVTHDHVEDEWIQTPNPIYETAPR